MSKAVVVIAECLGFMSTLFIVFLLITALGVINKDIFLRKYKSNSGVFWCKTLSCLYLLRSMHSLHHCTSSWQFELI